MKDWVARAMQVSYLTREQLEKVHDREKIRGYLIPNWNIQEVLALQTIKEKYYIPEDNELLIRHNARIEAELKSKGFLKFDEYKESDLDWMHTFDWNVFNRSGEIMWEFAGSSKSKSGILNRLNKVMGVFL